LIAEGSLDDVNAHNAFRHLFAEGAVYRFVEFSFPQLLETRKIVGVPIMRLLRRKRSFVTLV